MTPEEKAQELIDKFIGKAYDGNSSAFDNAKDIAIIAVDEIIGTPHKY